MMTFMKKTNTILIFLFILCFLFVSCDPEVNQTSPSASYNRRTSSGSSSSGSATTETTNTVDYSKWNSSYENYKIEYNTETKTFETDCPYVCFIEKDPNNNSESDFVILNLTDIQIPLVNLYEANDEVILFKNTFTTLVSTYKPDLITITGDFGDYDSLKDSLIYLADYIDSFKIPWAPVFGNHDNEGSTVTDKAEYLENCEHCLFKTGPTNLGNAQGTFSLTPIPLLGNYIVNVVKGDKLINSLIFMNTGNLTVDLSFEKASDLTSLNYGKLTSKQIEWYEWAVKSAQDYNSSVKSSLFIHIPIFEYGKAICAAIYGTHSIYNKSELTSYSYNIPLKSSSDEQYWNDGYKDSFGVIYDSTIATSYYEDNVFASIKKMNSTNLVVCGHDHKNNTVINHQGVQLVYGTKTGKGCYWSSQVSGGTKINISENKTVVRQIIYTPGSEITVIQ